MSGPKWFPHQTIRLAAGEPTGSKLLLGFK
jgi:hypothetical protein